MPAPATKPRPNPSFAPVLAPPHAASPTAGSVAPPAIAAPAPITAPYTVPLPARLVAVAAPLSMTLPHHCSCLVASSRPAPPVTVASSRDDSTPTSYFKLQVFM